MFESLLLVLAVTSVVSSLSIFTGYNPETDNIYYLCTRNYPTCNQILINGNASQIRTTDFNSTRNTAVIIHGWQNSASSPVNTVLVPAFLAVEDRNVIVVDWSVGAEPIYNEAVYNTIISGPAVASFLTWLNNVTGADVSQYQIVGHSLGAHQAGIVGRRLDRKVPYIVALDPASPGFEGNIYRFKSTDAIYTEAIHSNAGGLGFPQPLAHVDMYPNGGSTQPGCGLDASCDHGRSYLYFAESIMSDGFNAVGCPSYQFAMAANCAVFGNTTNLKMGGNTPKTGCMGIYFLKTNSDSPYSDS